MDVKFTPSARAQFLASVASIRRHNPTAARDFRARVERGLKRLRRFLASGATLAEFPDLPFRELFVTPYRFFYSVRDETVWVVGVWHGAQIPEEPEGPEDG